jgi:cyclic dehypoxanthinyl futalosine synthase
LKYGADDFDLPIEDEVTQKAGATISLDFERILNYARELGYSPEYRHVSLGRAEPTNGDRELSAVEE